MLKNAQKDFIQRHIGPSEKEQKTMLQELGYKNLEKATRLLDDNDKNDFFSYINKNTSYNPHIMCIARPEILDKWFSSLFPWLKRCEEEFGFDKLKGYDTLRLYAYLAERYLSFWFKKYTKYKEQPWVSLVL